MLDFNKLPYNQLQKACKERNLSAKGKVSELIQRLFDYENNLKTEENKTTDVNSTSNGDLSSAFSSLMFGNKATTVIEPIETTQTLNTSVTENNTTKVNLTPNKATFNIDKILVHVNGFPVSSEQKEVALKYCYEIVQYLEKHDRSRLVGNLPDNQGMIRSIDIQMRPAFEYVYGQGISKVATRIKNGKSVQSIDAIQNDDSVDPQWTKQYLVKRAKSDSRNRNKTAFEIGLISPSSSLENSQVMNGKAEEVIFFQLYQPLQIKNKELDKTHPDHIRKTDIRLCPYIQHLKINDKFVVSGLIKLTSKALEKSKKIQEKVNEVRHTHQKFKSGYLDGWSNHFTVTLTKDDYLSDRLGCDPVNLQIRLEENETLALYIVDQKTYTDARTKQITRQYSKLLTLASVEIDYIPMFNWIATQPRFEIASNQLNKYGKLLPSLSDKFANLVLTKDELKIGDRVLCKKISTGNKLVIRAIPDSFLSDNDSCQWLCTLVRETQTKMIKGNHQQLKEKLELNCSQNKDESKARYNIRKLIASARRLNRQHNPAISEDDSQRLATAIVNYLMVNLGMSKSGVVGYYHKLTADRDMYLSLVEKVVSVSR